MQVFLDNFAGITWQMPVMWLIGGVLIYLAIKHDMEPTLLLPMGFGAILMNLPAPAEVVYNFEQMKDMLLNIGMNVDVIYESGSVAAVSDLYSSMVKAGSIAAQDLLPTFEQMKEALIAIGTNVEEVIKEGGEAHVAQVFNALAQSGAIEVEKSFDGISSVLKTLYNAGIANELFPLLLFIGIGAMIDFGPLLSNPKMLLFGAAAQFGIFFTLSMARLFGFSLTDAASIAIIGAADGPTSIAVANHYGTKYIGAIVVAAYSYMALVPVVQPACIRLITTKKERMIRMEYNPKQISKTTRILFPILVSIIAGIAAPASAALIGFLMFGNLIRECGVLDSLSDTAQKVLANLITLFLGITVAFNMTGEAFLDLDTLLIMGLGLVAFIFDTFGGVMFAKFLNLFTKNKINPMVGAAGISAFPMSSRVVHKMALKEDPYNFLLMHAAGANVAGQIASVIAGGLIMSLIPLL